MPFIPVAVVNRVVTETAPDDPPPVAGFIAHYDASDAGSVTLTAGRVSQWDDQVGSFHATNATSTTRPGWPLPASFDGQTAMVFCNTGSALNSSASTSDMSCTWFATGCIAGDAGGNFTIVGANTGGGLQIRITDVLLVLKQATAGIATSTAVVPKGEPFVIAVALTASDCTTYVGTTAETDGHAQTLTVGRTLVIGAAGGLSEGFSGWLGEILCYDTTLVEADILTTIDYLATKWNVSV